MQSMTAFPFTSILTYDEHGWPQLDRGVTSEVLRKILKSYYTNGVFGIADSNCLQVMGPADASSPTVRVKLGVCLINGATGYTEGVKTLDLTAGDTTLPRIDTVVCRLNDNSNYRNIYLDIILGTPASTPVAPALTQTDSVWEIGLANIYRAANSTVVSSADITDTRLDTSRCGYVTAIQSIDTESLMQQLNAYYDAYVEDIETYEAAFKAALEGWEADEKQSFEDWWDDVKDLLDPEPAGQLALAIQRLRAQIGIPDEYDPERIYEPKEYCIHDNTLQKCTTETIGGGFDAGYWRATTVIKEIELSVAEAQEAMKAEMAKGSLAIDSGLAINNSGDRLIVNEDSDLLAVRQTIKFNFA